MPSRWTPDKIAADILHLAGRPTGSAIHTIATCLLGPGRVRRVRADRLCWKPSRAQYESAGWVILLDRRLNQADMDTHVAQHLAWIHLLSLGVEASDAKCAQVAAALLGVRPGPACVRVPRKGSYRLLTG